MEDLLKAILMIWLALVVSIAGFFTLRLDLIVTCYLELQIWLAGFRRKRILLNEGWCSYIEKGDQNSCSSTVLMLHGFASESSHVVDLLCSLRKADHIICMDLPNHGFSATLMKEVSSEDMLKFVRQFVEKSGLRQRRVHLVGYSLGGLISILYASTYQDELASLILISSAGVHKGCRSSLKLHFSSNKDLAESIGMTGYPSVIQTICRYERNRQAERLGFVSRSSILWERMDDSVLVKLANTNIVYIQGEDDSDTPKEGMYWFLKHVSHTEYHIIPKGSHHIIATHVNEICTLIDDWLQRRSEHPVST